MNIFFKIYLLGGRVLLGAVIISACSRSPNTPTSSGSVSLSSVNGTPCYTYIVVATYPHDQSAFTQGLIFENGFLYEGTGLLERSTLRKVKLETGDILKNYKLPAHIFAEGITIYKNKIIQLTWRSHVGFVYDKESFELLRTFSYSYEGWGITYDGNHLVISDGTSVLHFLDPESFTEIKQVKVFDHNGPVTRLNELEYVRGEIYANVWPTDRIARIIPHTGQVHGWVELQGLLNPEDYRMQGDVLNGIAYDEKNERLFVTGKLWPKLFEIEIVGCE